jgi:hypothetical protein
VTDVAEFEDPLPPSRHEREFDAFLKGHALHISQSPCGLGWVARVISNSDKYRHSVSLDVADETLRSVLPNIMGHRSLFRFIVPTSEEVPHLTNSDQKLLLPGIDFQLPRNPNLDLDIAALLMLGKSQAQRTLWKEEVEPSVSNITLLMAIWFGRYSRQSIEFDQAFNTETTEQLHPEIAMWLAAGAPTYLTLAKFIHPEQTETLMLDEALEARGIASQRLAALYPIESKKSPF